MKYVLKFNTRLVVSQFIFFFGVDILLKVYRAVIITSQLRCIVRVLLARVQFRVIYGKCYCG